jgi:hypothetical protein
VTSRLEVLLVGAEVHPGLDGGEVASATFIKSGDGAQAFTVDAPPGLAKQLMKSPGSRFAIVIETVTAPPSHGALAYRLLSAVAMPAGAP